jgi:hypothetical protein
MIRATRCIRIRGIRILGLSIFAAQTECVISGALLSYAVGQRFAPLDVFAYVESVCLGLSILAAQTECVISGALLSYAVGQ